MRKIVAGLLAALPLLAFGQDASSPRERDRWYIGFGLAAGAGRLTVPSGTATFKDYLGGSPTTLGLNFKVGATITPKILVGLDLTGVNSATNDSGYHASIRIVNYDAMLTWFPAGDGFFLRGGLGLSRFSYRFDLAGAKGGNDANGTNLAAGLGYAFWLGRSFNLTVNLDASGQAWSDDAGLRSSSFVLLGLGFDWY
jgi:hypothetical protein